MFGIYHSQFDWDFKETLHFPSPYRFGKKITLSSSVRNVYTPLWHFHIHKSTEW